MFGVKLRGPISTGLFCLLFVAASLGSQDSGKKCSAIAPKNSIFPWSTSKPLMFLRLDSEIGYHLRNPEGRERENFWLDSEVGHFQNNLFSFFKTRKPPDGKAILVYLPGPYTVVYFDSRHNGQGSLVVIQVLGRVNIDSIISTVSEQFADVWRVMKRDIEVVKIEDLDSDLPN
jgi:hypothetical protein